jgi:hypothetical protein
LTEREEDTGIRGDEGEGEPWIELIDRVDSPNFSKLFRNIVLAAGLLHLRESSESALRDLETIVRETDKFSKRITLAKDKHPEVKVLTSIESNLGEFSLQTEGFHKALLASELRGELELLSLSLLLSRSPSHESKARKDNLAKRVTRLARFIKARDERLKETEVRSSDDAPAKEEHRREEHNGASGADTNT